MLARGVPPPPLPRPCPLQTISYSSGNRCVFSFCFGSKSTTAATSCHKKASTLIKATAHLPSSLPFRSNQDDPDADAAPEDTTETLAAAPESTASPPPSTRAVSSRFQRLKASKIKVLAQKASLRKQQDQDKSPLKDATVDSSISSHSASRYTRKGHERKMSPTSLTDKFQEKKNHHKREGSHMLPDKLVPHTPKNSGSKTIGGGLTSRGWGHEGSSHSFKSEPTDRSLKQPKISAQTDFFSVKSFKDIGCSEFLIESLKRQAFFRPSHIQAMAFPPVIEGKSCIIADQSGSGKTLAYLLPLIQRLRQEELLGHGKPSLQGPQVLIMVPTSELGSQVLNNCRSISKYGVPFRSMVVTGGFRQRTQVENLEQGVDVLIATPGRFMFLINEGFLNLQNLRCAVLDEVDILLNDEDFEVSLQSLINSSSLNTQYLFVTATLPVDVYNKLVEAFPDCQVISGPGLHRLNARVEEILIDCSGKEEMEKTPETAFLNKKSALLQLVEQTPVAKTIVFCNKIESCRKVENILKRFDRKGSRARVLPFHAALSQELRLANMKEFMNSESGRDSFFLVCTDRASRGIDFAGVDHVVLFDFPRDPSEYVRRVGRTARGAGGKGRAFIFAVGQQVSLARRIIERNQKGRPLHDVPFARELIG